MLALLGTVFTFSLFGQGASHIYLTKIHLTGETITFSTPVKITTGTGYNNQPYFTPCGSYLLYSSGDNQTDVFRYNLKTKKSEGLTHTPESEYSPTPMAGGTHFSVIQQINTKGPLQGAQQLRAFPMAGGESKLLFYEKGKKVGYHAWTGKDQVVAFILGEPHTLELIDLTTKKRSVVAGNIGRSIYRVPGKDAVSFTHYKDSEVGVIKSVHLKTLKMEDIMTMKKGGDYYAWTPGGSLFTAVGGKLYKFTPGKDKDWRLLADFSVKGLSNITRLALDSKGQWLALVNNK